MKKILRLVVTGAAGRMGRRVAALAAEDRRFQVAALVDSLPTYPPRIRFDGVSAGRWGG